MPTLRQRKLAEAIVENATKDKPLNKKELLVSSGYSEVSAGASAKDVMEAQGVKESLIELGFNEETAKSVVGEILTNPKVAPKDRIRAASEVFKVAGSYAPEKKATLNVNLEARSASDQELETLRLEYEEKLRNQLTA